MQSIDDNFYIRINCSVLTILYYATSFYCTYVPFYIRSHNNFVLFLPQVTLAIIFSSVIIVEKTFTSENMSKLVLLTMNRYIHAQVTVAFSLISLMDLVPTGATYHRVNWSCGGSPSSSLQAPAALYC